MKPQLGLIGDNIAKSRAPRLHRLAGAQSCIEVSYDRLVPADLGQSFDAVFEACRSGAFRGINVTYPYKERVTALVTTDDHLVRRIGAVNTVILEDGSARGYNTDHSGFIAAYRNVRGDAAPVRVLTIGYGGVGRAVGFGLVRMGTSEIRLVDRDPEKAQGLAQALRATAPDLSIVFDTDADAMSHGAEGVVNCTPVGMYGYEGPPLPRVAMQVGL